jgi:hypothetical protein
VHLPAFCILIVKLDNLVEVPFLGYMVKVVHLSLWTDWLSSKQ